MRKIFSIETFIWFSISVIGTILSKLFFPDFEIIIPVLFGYYVTNILNKNGTIAKLVLAVLKLLKIKTHYPLKRKRLLNLGAVCLLF